MGQKAGHKTLLAGQHHLFEQFIGLFCKFGIGFVMFPEYHPNIIFCLEGQTNIFQHRQAGEYIGELKRAAYPKLCPVCHPHPCNIPSIKQNLSRGGGILPGNQVEQSGFTGPVGADNRFQAMWRNHQIKAIDRDMAAELNGQLPGFNNRCLNNRNRCHLNTPLLISSVPDGNIHVLV